MFVVAFLNVILKIDKLFECSISSRTFLIQVSIKKKKYILIMKSGNHRLQLQYDFLLFKYFYIDKDL